MYIFFSICFEKGNKVFKVYIWWRSACLLFPKFALFFRVPSREKTLNRCRWCVSLTALLILVLVRFSLHFVVIINRLSSISDRWGGSIPMMISKVVNFSFRLLYTTSCVILNKGMILTRVNNLLCFDICYLNVTSSEICTKSYGMKWMSLSLGAVLSIETVETARG